MKNASALNDPESNVAFWQGDGTGHAEVGDDYYFDTPYYYFDTQKLKFQTPCFSCCF